MFWVVLLVLLLAAEPPVLVVFGVLVAAFAWFDSYLGRENVSAAIRGGCYVALAVVMFLATPAVLGQGKSPDSPVPGLAYLALLVGLFCYGLIIALSD